MKDEAVDRIIQSGAERKPVQPQSQNTPADHHPPPKVNSRQVTKPGKTQSKERWFLTEQGAFFVQLLNSKLEKIIDTSAEIEKIFKDQCLRFSFQKKRCRVVVTFPRDFPRSSLEVTYDVPEASAPLQFTMLCSQLSEEHVDRIVKTINNSVPTLGYCSEV